MNIRYTNHAEYQLKTNRKSIEKIWVEETIKFPDKITADRKKHYAVKKLNGLTLKVVYVKEEKYLKVVTQYWIK